MLYSIKMRASQKDRHISGAERIVEKADIDATVGELTTRAVQHSLGCADFINLKIETVSQEDIQYLEALPVSERFADSIEESYAIMGTLLAETGVKNPQQIVKLLQNVKPMRGAALYDISTQTRIEDDPQRGIRVTYMDAEGSTAGTEKNHFREALILATKVANAPGILAEICLSDDPEYVTGYFASKKHGYVRLSPLKNSGDTHGGRIFIIDNSRNIARATIAYLENKKVLVRNLPAGRHATASPEEHFRQQLQELKAADFFRSVRTIDSQQSSTVTMNGKEILMLSSNSYLDLAADPQVKAAAAQAALTWGAGSGGSRLTTGTMTLHTDLERLLAQFKRKESALLYNTGYMANVGSISALADKNSVIFSDEYNHASIIDGCRLSSGKTVIFKHNDMHDLERKIKSHPCSCGIIVSDAVFSMDGDIANLPEIVRLGRAYNLLTMVDEAHATGVIGNCGKGIAEYYDYQYEPDIIMGTLSKALGAEGGFICAGRNIIEYLINKSRSFIFSTAQAPATLGAALAALRILTDEPQRVRHLQENIKYFCSCLQEQGLQINSPTAIIPIPVGSEKTAVQISQELLNAGCLIPAIRYPTVPRGTARLRVALMATHAERQLRRAAELIAAAVRKYS